MIPGRADPRGPLFLIEETEMKHGDIISKLTLDEKCYLLSGKDFWSTYGYEEKGVPSIWLSDGPHGIRKQEGAGDQLGLNGSIPATCFPTAATMANSWDPELGEEIGRNLGEEAACQQVAVLLGPGLNIKRSPLCGRNFEYFSEDPYLAGKMAAGYIRGIQENGISACPKHFACNNTELRRQASNSVLDERTFREIYLTGFEIAVKEGHPKSIMSAYNEINGVYANENEHLLQEILRDEWGFDGFVVSDWGAGNDFLKGVHAGSHLEMPTTGGDSPEQLIAAVKAGKFPEEMVDRRVDELLDVVLSTAKAVEPYKGRSFDVDKHHEAARKASEQSIVLLKNEESMLPLKAGTRVAVIGDFAETPRYQGAGSSVVNPTRLDSALDVIKDFPLEVVGFEKGYPRVGAGDPEMQNAAVELAKQAEVVLMYIGLDEISESEGLDRPYMKVPESQVDLLKAVYAVNPNIVAVMAAGSSVEMPWIDCCKAMVHGYLCGQAGASAILEVIMGDVNPSGKLSESYPYSYDDVSSKPYFPAKERSVEYREGLYVGYRYYDKADMNVLFPFGFGLSYTTFEYSDIKADTEKVTFTVRNSGDVDGAEVAQLYISAVSPKIYRPAKELKGFAKVFLKAGESKEVTIPLDDKAFRYFNVKTNKFEIDGGEYEILVGASSRDIRLTAKVEVEGTDAELPYELSELPSYASGDILAVTDEEFTKLLGHKIPDGSWTGDLRMNDAIAQLYYAKSLKARLVGKILQGKLDKSMAAGKPDLNIIFVSNMPFRAIGKMAGGAVNQDMCRSIVKIVNGHAIAFIGGLGGLIGGYFHQQKVMKKAKSMK